MREGGKIELTIIGFYSTDLSRDLSGARPQQVLLFNTHLITSRVAA